MDPDACLRLIAEAIKDGEPYAEHMANLKRWLVNGGFAPDWTKYPEAAHEYTLAYVMDYFVTEYIRSALWSSTDDRDYENGDSQHGKPMDDEHSAEDLAPATLLQMIADCKKFREDNAADLEAYPVSQAAHDFWLTRNHHGCGFWEDDFGEHDANERLTQYCHKMGEVNLYVGDDGKIYC